MAQCSSISWSSFSIEPIYYFFRPLSLFFSTLDSRISLYLLYFYIDKNKPREIAPFSDSDFLVGVAFNDVKFVLSYNPDNSTIGRTQFVLFFGSGIRFGRHQIGVGSTRQEVERAYRRQRVWSESINEIGMPHFRFFRQSSGGILREHGFRTSQVEQI